MSLFNLKIKKISIFLLFIFNVVAIQVKALDTKEKRNYKAFVLSSCFVDFVQQKGEGDNIKLKKDMYTTTSKLLYSAHLMRDSDFEKTFELLEKWYQKEYKSEQSDSLNLKRCFDLFFSKDLEELYQEITICNYKDAENRFSYYSEYCTEIKE